MANVTVTPEEFTMVRFDSARIRDLASAVADAVGLANDLELRIEVDEQSPLGRTRVTSFDPVTITTESGAFEDPRRIRDLSDANVQDVLGRLLMRVRDRLDPVFGDPPPDKELSVQQHTAWDAYAVGRCARLGLPTQRQRRLYHFRIRHLRDALGRRGPDVARPRGRLRYHRDGPRGRGVGATPGPGRRPLRGGRSPAGG